MPIFADSTRFKQYSLDMSTDITNSAVGSTDYLIHREGAAPQSIDKRVKEGAMRRKRRPSDPDETEGSADDDDYAGLGKWAWVEDPVRRKVIIPGQRWIHVGMHAASQLYARALIDNKREVQVEFRATLDPQNMEAAYVVGIKDDVIAWKSSFAGPTDDERRSKCLAGWFEQFDMGPWTLPDRTDFVWQRPSARSGNLAS